MGRSKPRGRRSIADRPSQDPPSPHSAVEPAPSLASATLPRVWQDVGYRPLSDPGSSRTLFDFAAVPWPESAALEPAWGAWRAEASGGGERLVGAVVGERAGPSLFLHGPVVVADQDAREVAAQLVASVLDHARALAAETVFTRPQGLDRVWVRFGFIPVPEGALPRGLRGRPGSGLYAWRGGSALWTFREGAETAGERAEHGAARVERGMTGARPPAEPA